MTYEVIKFSFNNEKHEMHEKEKGISPSFRHRGFHGIQNVLFFVFLVYLVVSFSMLNINRTLVYKIISLINRLSNKQGSVYLRL